MEANTMDVSCCQGNIDWANFTKHNPQIKAVIVKAGNGNEGFDSKSVINVHGATDAGLLVGIYNVVYPLPPNCAHPNRDPEVQASEHWEFCSQFGNVLTAIDLETPSIPDWEPKWGINGEFITDWVLTYALKYEQLSGRKPIIYSYTPYIVAMGSPSSFSDYQFWLADYNKVAKLPSCFTDYIVWQFKGTGGRLLGMSTDVDLDFCKDLNIFNQ